MGFTCFLLFLLVILIKYTVVKRWKGNSIDFSDFVRTNGGVDFMSEIGCQTMAIFDVDEFAASAS